MPSKGSCVVLGSSSSDESQSESLDPVAGSCSVYKVVQLVDDGSKLGSMLLVPVVGKVCCPFKECILLVKLLSSLDGIGCVIGVDLVEQLKPCSGMLYLGIIGPALFMYGLLHEPELGIVVVSQCDAKPAVR